MPAMRLSAAVRPPRRQPRARQADVGDVPLGGRWTCSCGWTTPMCSTWTANWYSTDEVETHPGAGSGRPERAGLRLYGTRIAFSSRR